MERDIPDFDGWNYRVLRHTEDDPEWYAVHEVWYNQEGEPISCTKRPTQPTGESLEEIERVYTKAFTKPALNYKDIVSQAKEAWDASPATPDTIIEKVASYYGLSEDELLGNDRSQHVADARHIAMYLVRETGRSHSDIGKIFNRDHSSVIHACQKIESQLGVVPGVEKRVEDLKSQMRWA